MMGLVGTIVREMLALFIDDGLLAAGIVAWIAVLALFAGHGLADQGWAGPLLFAGLAGLLVASVWQRARK